MKVASKEGIFFQEEGGVECLRAVEEIPAGVEVTISYRSIIGTLVTMRVTMKVAVRMAITMWLTVVMVISVMPYRLGRCDVSEKFNSLGLR